MKLPLDLGSSNFLFSYILVDYLTQIGVTEYCISPGSRSTPLTLAVHAHPKADIYPILDERSSAYFALGVSKASKYPIALICTSGTAGANYFPAIIEAYETNLPIIVLTADRPDTLRNVETNQTIDQRELFGKFVKQFYQVDEIRSYTHADHIQKDINYVSNLITQANKVLNGNRGPLHFNLPFSKPLEPGVSIDGIINYVEGLSRPKIEKVISKENANQEILDLRKIQSIRRVLLLVGPNTFDEETRERLLNLANEHQIPLLADPLSGLRKYRSRYIIRGYDHYMDFIILQSPDLIIKLGTNPVSSGIEQFISNYDGSILIVREEGYQKTVQSKGNPIYFGTNIISELHRVLQYQTFDRPWVDFIVSTENIANEMIKNEIATYTFEGGFVSHLLGKIVTNQLFFVANSLPIRHVSEFMTNGNMNFDVHANRGVSGIDGNISTFCGMANHIATPSILLVGDLASMHDLTGLFLIKRLNLKVMIVVLNNHGGGIFKRLPISTFEPQFTELFKMEYDIDFEKIAAAFELSYKRIQDYKQLDEIDLNNLKESMLIEIVTDSAENQKRCLNIKAQILSNIIKY